MHSPFIGFIEMGVVLMFGLGWAVLELVGLRLDRRRKEANKQNEDSDNRPV